MTTIGSCSTAARREIDDPQHPDDLGCPTTKTFAPTTVGREVARHIDDAVAAFAANALAPKPSNDDVIFVGINGDSVAKESDALARAGVSCNRIDANASDVFDGWELDTAEGRHGFVETLGLPANVGAEVERVLAGASPVQRGTVASIARAWAPGERDAAIPSRLVVSGHSGSGEDIWSAENYLELRNVRLLATAMPRAAAQIEDVHFSACSTRINASDADAWQRCFPNLKTIWSYNGAAPSPAGDHLVDWARQTRGRAGSLSATRENVAVWSASRGYRDAGMTTPVLRARTQEAYGRLTGFLAGTPRITDPHDAVADPDYRAVRALSTQPGIPPAEAARAKTAADQLLRIRFYELGVRDHFAVEHGATVREGFRDLGLNAPDFTTLTRAEALGVIRSFEERLANASVKTAAMSEASRLLRGLASLDASIIEEKWCQ